MRNFLLNSLLERNHKKSPIAPKLQKKPQNTLPKIRVAGMVAASVQTAFEMLSQMKVPANAFVKRIRTAPNVMENKPGINRNERI